MNSLEQDHNDRYNQVRVQQNLGTPCEDCGCEQGHKIYCCVFVRGARSTSAPDTVDFLRRKLTQPEGVPAVSFTDVVFSAEDVLRLKGLGVKG